MQILVLNASALNLGFLGCYGNAWVATPRLDELAAESVVFDQHFAENLDGSAGSVGLSFNNLCATAGVRNCIQLAARDIGTTDKLVKRTVKALQQMKSGNSGLCWVELPSLRPPWNVEEEFTEQYLVQISGGDEEEPEETKQVEALLDPPIGPFDAKDLALWDRLRGTYAGAVTCLDAGLGKLFDELREHNLFDKLVIIFTADRALALGEHGIVGDCRPWLHDEVVHLPLIVRYPDESEAGRRVFGLSQPADLTAMLLELLGLDVPAHNGQSLLPMMLGRVEKVREQCISRWALDDAEEWSLRTSDCAFLLPVKQPDDWPLRAVQFYLKPEDRWKVNNVIQHHLDLADELEKTLRTQVALSSA